MFSSDSPDNTAGHVTDVYTMLSGKVKDLSETQSLQSVQPAIKKGGGGGEERN